MKQIFKNNNAIPKNFIQSIEILFIIWRDKWEIYDKKYCQGLFMYTYNYNAVNNIEIYYSDYIKNELEKYSDTIKKINDLQKIKVIGFENGLDPESDLPEIITGLQKIKKMEIIINLSNDLDGNELPDFHPISDKETSTIQRILKNMNENFNNKNNDILNNNDKNNLKNEKKSLDNNNNEEQTTPENNNDEYYNDIDGEPL